MSRWMYTGYVIVTAALMSAFVMTQGMFKYVFSLSAIMVGMSLFKRVEELKPRIWFVVLVLLLTLIFPLLYVIVAMANGWHLNPDLLEPR